MTWWQSLLIAGVPAFFGGEGAVTGFFYTLGSFFYRDNTSQEEQTQTRPPFL